MWNNIGVCCHFLLQGNSRPTDSTWVSSIAGRYLAVWATREAPQLTLWLNVWEYDYFPDARLNAFQLSGFHTLFHTYFTCLIHLRIFKKYNVSCLPSDFLIQLVLSTNWELRIMNIPLMILTHHSWEITVLTILPL